nr:serine/threonine-protein kinase PknD [Mycobacterium gordonae]
MGEVWRAYDTVIDRTVAIKMLLPHFAQDRTFEQRFRREARAAARLDEPHAVPIYDVGEIDGRLYVAMRLVKGQELQTLLSHGPLQPDRAVEIIGQIASALDTAHNAALVHRDVKPSNILVTKDNFAYLIDFGIASAAGDTGMTTTGSLIGTWAYMAPERFSTGADHRADIYALACVLHECLTATRPFPGNSLEQQYAAHLSAPPPRPSVTVTGLAPSMDEVIARGMAKSPELRFQSATDLARAARVALSRGAAQPHPRSAERFPTAPNARQHGSQAVDKETPPSPKKPLRASPSTETDQTGNDATPALRNQRRRIVVSLIGSSAAIVAVITVVSLFVVSGKHASSWSQTVAFHLSDSFGVAVDRSGAVYATGINRSGPAEVTILAAGSNTPTTLPLTNVEPRGVAVDSTGAVYVADAAGNQVVKLHAGQQTTLPFVGLNRPLGVATDNSNAVYVADTRNNRVLKLAAGSTQQAELPFTGLNNPHALAIDNAGDVYVTDGINSRVLKLVAKMKYQLPLPLRGFADAYGLAADTKGAVYVVDHDHDGRVVKLAPDSNQQAVLPFKGLQFPHGVAIDSNGSIYVADGNNQVIKLEER